MAKAKKYPVIIDRMVTVELKGHPKVVYPAGWRGEVSGAALKIIKEMEAGRVEDAAADVPADAVGADIEAEIKAKHAAADAEIKKKHEVADETIAFVKSEALEKAKKTIADAEAKAAGMIADAEATVAEINAAATPDAGKAAG